MNGREAIEALRGGDTDCAIEAAHTLGAAGDPSATGPLADALDYDTPVALAAALSLVNFGASAIDPLFEVLSRRSRGVVLAERCLASIEEAAPVLLEDLGAVDDIVLRAAILRILSASGGSAVVTAVVEEALEKGDLESSNAAAAGIRRLGGELEVDLLGRALLDSVHETLSKAAADALVGRDGSTPLLLSIATSGRHDPAGLAVDALVSWNSGADAQLLEALQRGDAKTRSTAARVLSARGVPAATKALQASEEASLSLPVAFALSIAGAGAEEIEAILVELETRHDPEVLLLSARALIDRKALPEAAVLLERVVVESEGMYRKGAVVMLSDCGLAGLRALVRVMKHCTQERWTAAMSVGNIEGVEVLAELAPLVYEDNYGPLKWAAAFEMCREVYPPAIAAMKEVLIEGDVIDRRIAAETIRGLCLDGCEEVLALAATCDHDPAVRLYSGSFIPGHLRGVRRESFRRSSDGVPRSPETLPPLIDILENGNPSERAWAAIALGQAGRPKAAPALFEALFDGEDLVALEARRAIESLPV